MSSIINKVKDALSSDNKHPTQSTTSQGAHHSHHTNAADPLVDSSHQPRSSHISNTVANDGSYATGDNYDLAGGNRGVGGPLSNMTHGHHHNSNVTGASGTGLTGTSGTGLTGNRGINNDAIYSDNRHVGTSPHGTGVTTTTTGNYGTTTGTGIGGVQSTGPAPNTAGPHKSDMLNKMDPRVDSDLDGSRNMGAGAQGTSTTGTSLTGASGMRSTAAAHGHHNTGLMGETGTGNTMTTRQHNAGFGGHTGTSGAGLTNTSGTGVTHASGTGYNNASGSGYSNTAGNYGATTGTGIGGIHSTGPAPNTAGPHKSDMLNKMDPRVDSDLDGSKTFGGNKTFANTTQNSFAAKDPTDAAQVPPSVLQQHVGPPQPLQSNNHHHHGNNTSL